MLPSFLHSFGLDILGPEGLATARAWCVSIWIVGAALGVPLGMPICARYGRRSCLSLSAVLFTLGTAIQLSTVSSLRVFAVGRFLSGAGVGVGTFVSPM